MPQCRSSSNSQNNMRLAHRCFLLLAILLVTTTTGSLAWVTHPTPSSRRSTLPHRLYATVPEKIEVCGFKDCKSRGGGPRLQTLVQELVDQRGWPTEVEACDCQGECGYGPNILVDGRLVNGVKRNVDSVLQALGVPASSEEANQEEATTTTSATNSQQS